MHHVTDHAMRFALGMLFTLTIFSNPSIAQVPEPIPNPEWAFLQDEAVAVLAARGFPEELTPLVARDEIRAYALGRLLSIIQTPFEFRSDQEQAAYEFFATQVKQNRIWMASNAREYWESVDGGRFCWADSTDVVAEAIIFPVFLARLVCEVFDSNETSNTRETYRGAGAAVAYGALLEGDKGTRIAAMLDAIQWYEGTNPLDSGGKIFDPDSMAQQQYVEVLDFFKELRDSAKVSFMLSLVSPETYFSGGTSAIILGVIEVGITAWESIDFEFLGSELSEALATARTTDIDLESIVTGDQITELLLVFSGTVLSHGVAEQPCAFEENKQCFTWPINSDDPDFEAEIYGSLANPVPDPGDYFALKAQGTADWILSADLSPLNQDGNGIASWDGEGQSAYVSNGMLVQTPIAAGGANPEDSRYGIGFKYQNWEGEWWRAYWSDDTFLHVKHSLPVSQGMAQVSGFLQYDGGLIIQDGTFTDGYKYCKAYSWTYIDRNPGSSLNYAKYANRSEPDGNCVLFTPNADISQLREGDRILIAEQIKTIKEIVNCEADIGHDFLTQLFYNQGRCGSIHSQGSPNEDDLRLSRALIVDPPFLADDSSSWYPVRKYDLPFDSCAQDATGRDDLYPRCDPRISPSDLSACWRAEGANVLGGPLRGEKGSIDCFYSPMVQYQTSMDASGAMQNWQALYFPPPAVADDYYSMDSHRTAAISHNQGVLANDSILSTSNYGDKFAYSVSLVSDASHGALKLNADGSFEYTAGMAAEETDTCGAADGLYCGLDHFEYRVCAPRDGIDYCDNAIVELEVRNLAPIAIDVTLELIGSVYHSDYIYADYEDDPQAPAEYFWYLNGILSANESGSTLDLGAHPGVTDVAVGIRAHSTRGSWPNGESDTKISRSDVPYSPYFPQYLVRHSCVPEPVAFDSETECVFYVDVNGGLKFTKPIPVSIEIGTDYGFGLVAPDRCEFANLDTRSTSCTVIIKYNPDSNFADDGRNFTGAKKLRNLITDELIGQLGSFVRFEISRTVDGTPAAVDPPVDLPLFVINTTANPPNAGTVACGPSSPVPLGSDTGCWAIPNAFYKFDSWGGACAGMARCIITGVSAPLTIVANFSESTTVLDGDHSNDNRLQNFSVAPGSAPGWAFTTIDDPTRPSLGFVPLLASPLSPTIPVPAGYGFPYDLSEFVLVGGAPGSNAMVTITYPGPLPANTQYWKYDRSGPSWYQLHPSRILVNGNTITLTLTDGGPGDHDGVANGVIVDPGGPAIPGPLDVDQNGIADALTDGLMIIRHMFGFSGNQLTAGAVGAGASKSHPIDVGIHIESLLFQFDIDGDGRQDALTDGLMIIRHLFGFSGEQLTAGAVSAEATRTDPAEISDYIRSMEP